MTGKIKKKLKKFQEVSKKKKNEKSQIKQLILYDI